MAEIIDLARYRDSETGEIKPPSVMRLERDASGASTLDQRQGVQAGIALTARHLGVSSLQISGDYNGYLLAKSLGEGRTVIGLRGLDDFEAGFLAARGTTAERAARQAAQMAYGLYGAALLLLPDRFERDQTAQEARQQLAAAYADEHPETSVASAANLVTHWAAATWALVGLKDSISVTFRNNLQMVAAAGALVVSQEGLPVAHDFQHRLRTEDMMAVTGHPTVPKRPQLTLVQ